MLKKLLAALLLAALPLTVCGQILGEPGDVGFPVVFTLESGNSASWDVFIVNKDGLPVSDPRGFRVDSDKKSCIFSYPEKVAVLVTAAEQVQCEDGISDPKLWSFSFVNGGIKKDQVDPTPIPNPEPQPGPAPEPNDLTSWATQNVPKDNSSKATAFAKAFEDTATALDRKLIITEIAAEARFSKAVQPYTVNSKDWDDFRRKSIEAISKFYPVEDKQTRDAKTMASAFRAIAAGITKTLAESGVDE